jgi:hypothetical protein
MIYIDRLRRLISYDRFLPLVCKVDKIKLFDERYNCYCKNICNGHTSPPKNYFIDIKDKYISISLLSK